MRYTLDQIFMKQAFHLAKKGLSWTNPHPMVGAVIVKNGKIIARGYHHSFGGDHAEMDAIKNAEADIKRATMYVTLEPCHLPYDLHGPRIPCIKIIHQAGIRTVHIAMLDSNPEVAGRGRQELEKMDIRTTLGVLGRQVHELNETYHHFMKRRRPFIAATFSVSLDGKIATRTSDSKWITHKKARQFVMNNLWPSYQAVLVGINTVIQDNEPMKITNNLYKNPLRIVLDSHLRIPIGSNFLWDDNVIIATTHFANKDKYKQLIRKGIKVLVIEGDENKVSIKKLLEELYKRETVSILVEGGGAIHGSFFDSGLVDKVYAFYGPLIIGGEKAIPAVAGDGAETLKQAFRLEHIETKRFDDNFLISGYTSLP